MYYHTSVLIYKTVPLRNFSSRFGKQINQLPMTMTRSLSLEKAAF